MELVTVVASGVDIYVNVSIHSLDENDVIIFISLYRPGVNVN